MNAGKRKSEKGNTLYQIYSYDNFLFKISSPSFKKLYRYEFDPTTNEVVETLVFKRVGARNDAPKMKGTSTQSANTRYKVYPLISAKKPRGYMLYIRDAQTKASELMYFDFEKTKKKER